VFTVGAGAYLSLWTKYAAEGMNRLLAYTDPGDFHDQNAEREQGSGRREQGSFS
jgi:hypothetical protein